MQIILNHDEFLVLQTINARPEEDFVIKSRSKGEARIIGTLFEVGLIRNTYGHGCGIGHFGPMTITPIGRIVLQNHLPWLEPDFRNARNIENLISKGEFTLFNNYEI